MNSHSITDYRNGLNKGLEDLKYNLDRSSYILKLVDAQDKKSLLTGYLNSQGKSIKNVNFDYLY